MKRIVMVGTSPETQGGISTVVGVLKDAGLFQRCHVMYVPTHCDGGAAAKLAILAWAWLRFIFMLIAGRVGLLHAHSASRASFWRKSLFILPAFMACVPVILHLHGAEFQVFYEKECSTPMRRFVAWVFQRVDRVVTLSVGWGQWVSSAFPAVKVRVVPNPILVPPLTSRQDRRASTLLFLGRLGKRKGAYDLLEAVARLVPIHPDLCLWLGGDGEAEQVRQRADALGIGSHVELLGWVRGEDKSRVLNEAGIYVLPSYHEGLPMSVLEAMAHGLPVVSTPVGGIPEAVRDGVEGFLVPPGDEAALADRLRRLLSDEELRKKMGAAARVKVERCFSTDVVVPQFEALYAELLGKK